MAWHNSVVLVLLALLPLRRSQALKATQPGVGTCPSGYRNILDPSKCLSTEVRNFMDSQPNAPAKPSWYIGSRCFGAGPRGCIIHSTGRGIHYQTCDATIHSAAILICEEEDPCTTGTHDCHANAVCTNTMEGFTCACREGFRGTGKECYDHRVFSVECHELWVTGFWERVIFQASNLDLYVGDPSCGNYSQNSTHIWVTTNFTDCGSIIREQGNVIFQQNTAYITASYITGIMQRQVRYKYNMGCQFDRTINASSVDGFTTGIDEGGEVNLTRNTNFQAELQLFESPLFDTPMPIPMRFSSFQPMYVMVKETNENPSLKLVVQQCFATATAAITGPSYMFFGLKCPIDPTFQTLSSTNDHFQFTLQAFTFLQITGQIRIHCTLYVCQVNSTDPDCQQQCQRSRNRREISDHRERRYVTNEPPVGEMTLVSETIYFKKKPTCKDISCPANARCFELYPAACRCNVGFIWNRETKNCSRGHAILVRGVNLDMDIPAIYADPMSSVFNRFAMDFEDGVNKMVERDRLNSKKILGSKVLSVSPPSNTLDISILRDLSVLDRDTFKYFTDFVVVEMDKYPLNKYSQPKVYDILDTTIQMNDMLGPKRNVVIIETKGASVGINVVIPVVVVIAVAVIASFCLLFFCLRRRKRSSKEKNAIGMENKAVEGHE